MVRKASAVWKGGLKDGQGTVSVPSGVLKDVAYNFGKRFEDAPGTNPEELIAAAHASCFAMALSSVLGKGNLTPEMIDAKATLTFEKTDAGFSTTKIRLDVVAKVPGAQNDVFQKAADEAKRTCPISRLLNTTIELDAKLA
jgi:osmotically inducible protein OsmC